MHERDLRLVAQLARVATRHDAFRGLVQDDAVVGHEKDARQLVRHDDDGDADVAAERDDELVELDRRDRVEAGGRLVEEQEIGLEHQGAGDAGALLHAARDFARQVLGERTEPDEVELGLAELPHGGAADRRPRRQREREILGERHGAEERARLKEHAEGRHALVDDAARRRRRCRSGRPWAARGRSGTAAACSCRSRAAENRKRRAALDLEADVLHEHMRSPPDSQVVDDDVRPRGRHGQMPSSAKKSVNRALITITPKMARTTARRRAGADRGGAAPRGEPLAAGDQPDRERQKRGLDEAAEEVGGGDGVARWPARRRAASCR